MSFTATVKNEISKLDSTRAESISELSAILKNNIITEDSIKIMTENASVARHIFNKIKELYSISSKITVRQGYNYNKSYIYILEITNKISTILDDLSLNTNIPAKYICDTDDLIRAYLRGTFTATGSINDPKTSQYHLEMHIVDEEYAKFIQKLLNQYYLNSKILKRKNKYMIYIKEAEKIGDFLRMMNTIQALFYFEDIRIYRDHKNMTNRLNNCEQANIDKAIQTAHNQVEDIEFIIKKDAFELLDEKLIEVANYRLKYPDTTLNELSDIITMETGQSITKSGLHHRFNKIKELAQNLRNKS